MAHWHEPFRIIGAWGFASVKDRRLRVTFRGDDVRVAPFQGHFLRYEGSEAPLRDRYPHPSRNPEGWVQLWPLEPLLASSMEEAKEKFAPLLAQLERADFTGFERRLHVLPERPLVIRVIDHPTHLAQGVIAQRKDGVYQVGYRVYAPNARYFPAASPSLGTDLDFEWGITWMKDEVGKPLRTLASDLPSAEDIASRELDTLVQRDPEIKRR